MKGTIVCLLLAVLVAGTFGSPLSQLREYQEISIGHFSKRSAEHPKHLLLGFRAFDHPFQLSLQKQDLVSANYKAKIQKVENGKVVYVDAEHNTDCYYRGYHGDQAGETWAALSTCDGLVGVIHAHGETFQIEPHPDHFKRDSSRHIIFRNSDLGSEKWSCGTKDSSHAGESAEGHAIHEKPQKKATLPDNTPRYLGLYVVSDLQRYTSLGSSTAAVLQDTLTVVNVAKVFFDIFALNFELSLIGQTVNTAADPWAYTLVNGSADGDALVTAFANWALPTSLQYDVMHLFTGYDLVGDVVGKALLGEACMRQGVGLDQVTYARLPRSFIGATVAHEIGHNLGMQHDSVGNACPARGFVMAATSDSTNPPTEFSSCSEQYVRTWEAANNNSCLLKQCGNGIVEGDEACDAAGDACCNPATCQLQPGCACANSQACCDNGQFRPSSFVCRAAAGQCDVAERCTGSSGTCPADTLVNGTACTDALGGEGVCFQSYCLSALLQCKQLNPAYQRACNVAQCGLLGCSLTSNCNSFDQFSGTWAPGTPCGSGLQCNKGACVKDLNCNPITCEAKGATCGTIDNKCGNKAQKCGTQDCLSDSVNSVLNCFIATAAYGSPMDPHVESLRIFRDRFLLSSSLGTKLVEAYYTYSPPVAALIERSDSARAVVRALLWPVVFVVENFFV